MNFKKIKKWLLYAVVGSIAMHFIMSFIFSNDKYKEEVERHLVTNPKIKNEIGKVVSSNLYKIIAAEPSTSRGPAYRKYYFHVKAEKSDAEIVMRVDGVEPNNQTKISVVSIYPERGD